MTETPILDIRDLHRDFGGIHALRGVDLRVRRGCITGLIGPNGSGKTTLFQVVSGMDRGASGEVRFDGRPILGLRPSRIYHLGLARTFQLSRVFPGLTVLENLLVAGRPGDRGARERALGLIEKVQLCDHTHVLGSRLSYGQQKLVEFLRVLMRDPALILLDEPAAGVNPTLRQTLWELVRHVNGLGASLLIIEHNMNVIEDLCDEVYVLNEGEVIAQGAFATVRHDPQVPGGLFRPYPQRHRGGAMSPPLLAIRGLEASYGPVQALFGVDLEVAPGEIVAIIGPNGAGKSTVIKSVIGLVRVTGGQVVLEGTDITGIPTHQAPQLGIGYVPQGRIVFSQMTVRENLEMGAFLERDRRLRNRLVASVLDQFPRLAERQHTLAGRLSGGEQQMLAIGRALMMHPRLLILDEPSLGLSPKYVDLIYGQLLDLRGRGHTLLMVEQNAARALELCDRGYALELGRNRYTDTGQALLANGEVRRMYLGGT